jgi:hypothetical protein
VPLPHFLPDELQWAQSAGMRSPEPEFQAPIPRWQRIDRARYRINLLKSPARAGFSQSSEKLTRSLADR